MSTICLLIAFLFGSGFGTYLFQGFYSPFAKYSDSILFCRFPYIARWDFCACISGYGKADDGKCQPCVAGTFREFSYTDKQCLPCPPNTYCPRAGTRFPITCEPGQFSSNAAILCKPCPVGTYKSPTDVVCLRCPINHQCLQQGSTSPHACPPGSASTGDHHLCNPCTTDFFVSPVGACTPCPAGYGNSHASKPCLCKPGFGYSGLIGQHGNKHSYAENVCVACPRGYYKSLLAMDSCTSCSHGKSTVNISSTLQTDCVSIFSTTILKSVAHGIIDMMKGIPEMLNRATVDLFGSREEFEESFKKWWSDRATVIRATDNSDIRATDNSDNVCIFKSKEHANIYMMNLPLYKEWRRMQKNGDCKGAKKKARELHFIFHPDKFCHSYPACAEHFSHDAAQTISNNLNADKEACHH